MQTSSSLVQLEVETWGMNDTLLHHLCLGLRNNSTLRKLSIGRIQAAGMVMLGNSLTENGGLEHLEIEEILVTKRRRHSEIDDEDNDPTKEEGTSTDEESILVKKRRRDSEMDDEDTDSTNEEGSRSDSEMDDEDTDSTKEEGSRRDSEMDDEGTDSTQEEGTSTDEESMFAFYCSIARWNKVQELRLKSVPLFQKRWYDAIQSSLKSNSEIRVFENKFKPKNGKPANAESMCRSLINFYLILNNRHRNLLKNWNSVPSGLWPEIITRVRCDCDASILYFFSKALLPLLCDHDLSEI